MSGFGKSTLRILLITTIFGARPLSADENRWSTDGPYEASVFSLAIDPRDSQRIFAGTIENGLYLTTDGGDSWSHIEDDTLNSTLYDIAFHPAGPDTMYAATWSGMYRSYDSGTSWGLLRPPGYWYSTYNDIEVHAVHHNIVLAGADLATGYRSTDGGNNWTHLDLPWIAVLAIRTDPLRPDTMYLASQSAHYGLSVMRSEDLGVNWYSVHNDLDSGLFASDLQIDPVDSDILYLAGSRLPFTTPGVCLEKTIDAGRHWFDITPDGLIEHKIWSLTISPFDNQILYICTRANGVLKSVDGGESWNGLNEGLAARNVFKLRIDPVSGHLYIGTAYQGIFRSTDEGATWEKISDNINQAECTDIAVNPRNPDTVYVATRGGVYRSIDGASSWERLDLDVPFFYTESQGVAIDPYDPDNIFISFYDYERVGEGGIFRSTDGGESWQIFTSGLPAGGYYRRIAIANYGDGTRRIFLGGIGLYYSDNLGENWQLCGSGLPSNYYYWGVEVSAIDPYLVFAINGSEPAAFYRSTDSGNTWTSLPAPPGVRTINTIACDPENRDIVYVCRNEAGAFKSTDSGETWIDITNNLPGSPDYFGVFGIAVNPLNPSNLYVNSSNRGNFVSHDGGQNWEAFNEGLDTGFYDAMTIISPSDTNRVYLATTPKSVWSITRTQSDIEDEISPPARFIAFSSFPNPFNSSTMIEFSIYNTEHITLSIYNLLGQRLETIFDGIQQAGQHSITWDATDFPSGVYFARLKTAESTKNIKLVLLK